MRCKHCMKTTKNSHNLYCWREHQLCGECYNLLQRGIIRVQNVTFDYHYTP